LLNGIVQNNPNPHTMKNKCVFALLLTLPLILSGCATILDGGAKTVQIDSNPEGAKVTIKNDAGKAITVETTPATVPLDRSAGFFKGADYTLTIEKPGYFPYEAHVGSDLDSWYVANAIFGGLIGMLIVDPMTGDMYTLTPRKVDCDLISIQAPGTAKESNNAQSK
jgi:hypothetical protein